MFDNIDFINKLKTKVLSHKPKPHAVSSNMKNFFKIPYKRIFIEILLVLILVPLIAYNNIYFPIKKIENNINFDYEEVIFNSIDNTKLSGWYFPAKENKNSIGKNMPVIILSHGNWGNVSYFTNLVIPVVKNGYNVFIYDYRGFGKSKGFPYENGLYKDLEAAIKYINSEKKVKNKDIILWGLSIGGGVVSKIAAENGGDNFKAVILQSTFSSIQDMGVQVIQKSTHMEKAGTIAKIYPNFQKYDTYSRIDKIKSPLFIIHSKGDTKIPYQMSEKLAQKNKNAKLKLVDANDHLEYFNSLPLILEFLNSL